MLVHAPACRSSSSDGGVNVAPRFLVFASVPHRAMQAILPIGQAENDQDDGSNDEGHQPMFLEEGGLHAFAGSRLVVRGEVGLPSRELRHRVVINERLMEAVGRHDVDGVRELLLAGADANHVRLVLMSADATNTPSQVHQPTTPLKLVMFAISDCLLGDEELRSFAKITHLLLQHGAAPAPAMVIAESRYGAYDKAAVGAFAEVWHIVARAATGSPGS